MTRLGTIIFCAAIALPVCSGLARADAGANDPVELAPDPIPASNLHEITASESPSNDSGPIEDQLEGKQDAPAPGSLESKSLGQPNGFLSARPESAPSAESDSSVLDKIDPRRNELLRVIGALVVVLVLLFFVKKLVSRAPGWLGAAARPSGIIEILARYPVGRGQSLLLLRVARRVLLIHQANGAMSTLAEITDPQEVASLLARLESGANERDAMRFRSTLRTFEAEYEKLGEQEAQNESRGQIVDLTKRRRAGRSRLLGRGEGIA